MSVIPMTPPSTPKDIKAAKRAVHYLQKDIRNIRRDIMRRKVGNVSSARATAARKEAQIQDLQQSISRSPAMKRSTANKYRRYRTPVRIRRRTKKSMRRRRVPLKHSIQASIAARSAKLKKTKIAKPFTFIPKRLPRAPRVPKKHINLTRTSMRLPQSPVRSAKKIISQPTQLSKQMSQQARKMPPSPQRTALSREAIFQKRKAEIFRRQLMENRLRMIAAKKADDRRKYISRVKEASRYKTSRRLIPKSLEEIKEAVRAKQQAAAKPKRYISVQRGRFVPTGTPGSRRIVVTEPRYQMWLKYLKIKRDKDKAKSNAIKQVAPPKSYSVIRQHLAKQPRLTKRGVGSRNRWESLERYAARKRKWVEATKRWKAEKDMIMKTVARRKTAGQESKAITAVRGRIISSAFRSQGKARTKQLNDMEKALAVTRAKKSSAQEQYGIYKKKARTFRKRFNLGAANIGAIRRSDGLADIHRLDIQGLSKLEQQTGQLGSVIHQLGNTEALMENQIDVAAEMFGEMKASTLYRVNKHNRGQTEGLENYLAKKLLSLNQNGKVSGEGIQKAKAVIRLFDRRQLPFKEARKRIKQELMIHFIAIGGDMIQRDIRGAAESIQKLRVTLQARGKKFTAVGEAAFAKLLREYEVGQVKTMNELTRRAYGLIGNPHVVTTVISPDQLGYVRALGIAKNLLNRKARQLPGVRQLTVEKRAYYERIRVAEDEAAKARYEKVYKNESLAGFFPRTRSAMERLVR